MIYYVSMQIKIHLPVPLKKIASIQFSINICPTVLRHLITMDNITHLSTLELKVINIMEIIKDLKSQPHLSNLLHMNFLFDLLETTGLHLSYLLNLALATNINRSRYEFCHINKQQIVWKAHTLRDVNCLRLYLENSLYFSMTPIKQTVCQTNRMR